jgi:nitrogen fixation-related uncharacterized protein
MDDQSAGLWDKSLVFVGLLGLLFFGTAVYAFVWARRQRQFNDFDKGARSIFDEEEPEGRVTDKFPADATEAPDKGRDPEAKQTQR